jgi:hypothetical protein
VAATSASDSAADASNGRSGLTGQALAIIRQHPLVGVGPGNYSRALSQRPDLLPRTADYGVLPVHDMPLLAVAESGVLIVAPLAAVASLLLIGGLCRRGRWSPLLLAVVPYLLLDLVFWFYPEGLFLVAIAIGFVITGSMERVVPATVGAGASHGEPERGSDVSPDACDCSALSDAVAALASDLGTGRAELPAAPADAPVRG